MSKLCVACEIISVGSRSKNALSMLVFFGKSAVCSDDK